MDKQQHLDRMLSRLEACGATNVDIEDLGSRVHIRATVPTIGRAYYSIFQRGEGSGKTRVGEWTVSSFSNKMPPPIDENGKPYNYSYLTPLLEGYELVVRSKGRGDYKTYSHFLRTPDGKLHDWGLGSSEPYPHLEAFVRTLFAYLTGSGLNYMRELFGDRQPEIKRRAKLIRDYSFGGE